MAEVWKARLRVSNDFDRSVAIKRILPHYGADPHFRKMFVREAQICARLHHPNIVSVFDFGEVEGVVYLAMELVDGKTLTDLIRAQLRQQRPLDPGLATLVIGDVCRALAYAHALVDGEGAPLGLVHRDISPGNVMVSAAGAVKLLDFGVAKALQERREELTEAGTIKGKQPYMAPEQLAGLAIDGRADIFAAGVLLHEALTGRRLFAAERGLVVRGQPIPPPSALRPDVPAALDAICARALADDPDDRYARADDMAAALEAVVHELRFGPERLAAMMRELFEAEPPLDSALIATGATPAALLADAPLRPTDRSRRWILVAALGSAAALGTIAAWPHGSSSSDDHVVPAPPPVVAAPPPAAATSDAATPAPTIAPQVVLRVQSQPSGAVVQLEGERASRGMTPLVLTLPRRDTEQQVTLTANGYDVYRARVTLDQDRELLVALRQRPTHAAPAKKRPRPSARPAAVKQTLRGGGTVDPFAR